MEADVFICYLEEISSNFVPSQSNTPFKKPISKSFSHHHSSPSSDPSSSIDLKEERGDIGFEERKDHKTPSRIAQTKKTQPQMKESSPLPLSDHHHKPQEKKKKKEEISHTSKVSQDKKKKTKGNVQSVDSKKNKEEEKEIKQSETGENQEKLDQHFSSKPPPNQQPTTSPPPQTKESNHIEPSSSQEKHVVEVSPRTSFERSKIRLANLLEFLDENSFQFSDVENEKMDEIASNILELQHEEDEILKHSEEGGEGSSSSDVGSKKGTNKKSFHQAEQELNQLFSQLESFKHKISPNDNNSSEDMKERKSDGSSEEDGFFGSFFS